MRFFSQLYEKLVRGGFYKSTVKRPLIEKVLEEVFDGVLITQLPTGYGKTSIVYSTGLSTLFENNMFARVIHVLPLRTIIDDAFRTFKEGLERIGIKRESTEKFTSRQMMHVPGSPFLNKPLVFTTVDTFLMHLLKIPPSEIRKIAFNEELYGHYEFSRAAIFESLIVLDEPQQTIESGGKLRNILDEFSSFLYFLAVKARVPMIIMSATIPKYLQRLTTELMKNGVNVKILKYGEEYNGFRFIDKDFQNEELSKQITTNIYKCKGDTRSDGEIQIFVNKVKELSQSYERILVTLNTVERATRVFSKLDDAILLHGRLIGRERNNAISKLKGDRWILVATQVIEAGVNISAQALVTDASSANSLIQRAGRVARFADDDEGIINIVFDENGLSDEKYHGVYNAGQVKDTIGVLIKSNKIGWRLPFISDGIGYQQLIDEVYKKDPIIYFDQKLYYFLENPFKSSKDMLNHMLTTSDILRLGRLINVVVSDDHLELKLGEINSFLEENGYPANLELIKRYSNLKLLAIKGEVVVTLDDQAEVKKILSRMFPWLYMLHENIIAFQVGREEYERLSYGFGA